MNKPTATVTCPKCNGARVFIPFMATANGICFTCGGAGTIQVDAPAARKQATVAAYADARRAVGTGLDGARAWLKAHIDDTAAIDALWSALHDEGYTAEGNALYQWATKRAA